MYSDLVNSFQEDNLYNLKPLNELHNGGCPNSTTPILDFIDTKSIIYRLTETPTKETVQALWFSPNVRLYFVQTATAATLDVAAIRKKIEGTIETLSDWTNYKFGEDFTVFCVSRNKREITTYIILTAISPIDKYAITIANMQLLLNARNLQDDNIMGEIIIKSCDEFDVMVDGMMGLAV